MSTPHRTPKEIYYMHIQDNRTVDRSALIFGTTVAEMFDILEQGKKEYEAYLIALHTRTAKYRISQSKGVKLVAQMEALTMARGGLSYLELSEATGIQDSRIQRICKGEFPAYFYEILAIQKATKYDLIRLHDLEILEEMDKLKGLNQ